MTQNIAVQFIHYNICRTVISTITSTSNRTCLINQTQFTNRMWSSHVWYVLLLVNLEQSWNKLRISALHQHTYDNKPPVKQQMFLLTPCEQPRNKGDWSHFALFCFDLRSMHKHKDTQIRCLLCQDLHHHKFTSKGCYCKVHRSVNTTAIFCSALAVLAHPNGSNFTMLWCSHCNISC